MTGESAGSTAIAWKLALRGLMHFGAAGDRAARADRGDEDVDLAVGVLPEFLGGRLADESRGWPGC